MTYIENIALSTLGLTLEQHNKIGLLSFSRSSALFRSPMFFCVL